MLRIRVIQVGGQPAQAALVGEFGGEGGTIGRDASNQLALPDPDRHISRVQAKVEYDGCRHTLTDCGSNPTHLNGQPLGKGASATLRDGDTLLIGAYRLRVEIPYSDTASTSNLTQPNAAKPALGPAQAGDNTRLFAAPPRKRPAPTPIPLQDDQAPLLAAFRRGLGSAALPPGFELTPAKMELLGSLLRESVGLIVALLNDRSDDKQAMRADLTQAGDAVLNPLKEGGGAEAALSRLLAADDGGSTARRALSEARQDLQGHLAANTAGLGAALADVLAGFAPAALEDRLAERKLLDALLPANRKAKLWDLYEQHFDALSQQAAEDFRGLLGHAFLDAYRHHTTKRIKG